MSLFRILYDVFFFAVWLVSFGLGVLLLYLLFGVLFAKRRNERR